jgi:hypothetical protein
MSQLSPNHAQIITPSDSAGLGYATEFISFTNSGVQTLKVDTVGGEVGVSLILPTGQYRMRVTKVYATGTNVTNIVGYW